MNGTVQHDGSCSDPFPIKSGVKQGCVLAPTLFGVFFSLLLRYAFRQSEDGIFLHTRSYGSLFNLSRLREKTKVRKVLIRELLFADDAALTAHTEESLQRLITCFADACTEFGLTINLKKTNIMGQDVSSTPQISIGDHTLEVVDNFTYLGSNISSNLSLDTELNVRIGKAATAMARLAKRVWDSTMLTTNTKMKVYQACVLSTLLCGSEACMDPLLPSRTQVQRLPPALPQTTPGHHLARSRHQQGRLGPGRDIEHVCRANAETTALAGPCLPHGPRPHSKKDVLYGELATGSRPTGQPALRYKDVCKRDLRAGGVDPADLETASSDRVSWRTTVKAGIEEAELMRETRWEERRLRRQQRLHSAPSSTQASTFTCSNYSRPCLSRIGLYSHSRCCNPTTD